MSRGRTSSMPCTRSAPTAACSAPTGRSPPSRRPTHSGWSSYPTTRRSATGPPRASTTSLIENGLDLRVVDVALVVPVVAGVDHLGQRLALDRLHRRRHDLLADPDRVLRDRAGHDAVVDRVDLGLAGVEA